MTAGAAPHGIVTFVLTDIVGSTRLWEDAPAAMPAVLARHDTLIEAAVCAHGGVFLKARGEGDSTFSVFASVADAAAAAIAAQTALISEPWTEGCALHVRMALNTGQAVERDGDYYGPPVNRAARLRTVAVGGQILVSQATAELLGDDVPAGARLVDLGRQVLKDIGRAESVYQLAHLGDEPVLADGGLPAELNRLGASLFVGRSAELSAATAAWEAVRAGGSRVLTMAGEPGIGKTRLSSLIARRAHEDGAVVLYGRSEQGLGAPYQPVVEALRPFARRYPQRVLMAQEAGELLRLLPDVGRGVIEAVEAPRDDPETARWNLFQAVATFVAGIAAGSGLVIVLDDLQWSAPATLLLLRHLAHADIPGLLIVGVWRTGDGPDPDGLLEVLADLRRTTGVDHLPLHGLDETDLGSLLHELTGDRQPDAVVSHLLAQTAGNPFFVEELLSHLSESGEPLEAVLVPPSIRDVVARRVALLSTEAHGALQIAAVAGQQFDLEVVEAVSGLTGDGVLDALDEGVGAGLLTELAGRAGAYHFSHALVRQTLYDQLTAARRARLHWRVAEAIEGKTADVRSRAAELAYHFGQGLDAGDRSRAVDAFVLAGQMASSKSAHDEAVVHYRAALSAMESSDVEGRRRYDVLAALGDASLVLADLQGASQVWGEALALARADGDAAGFCRALEGYRSQAWQPEPDTELMALIDEGLAMTPPGDAATRARLLSWRVSVDLRPAVREAAEADALAALEMARRLEDLPTLGAVLGYSARALWGTARAEEVLALATEQLDVLAELSPSYQVHRDVAVAAFQLGDRARADAVMEELAERAGAFGSPFLFRATRVYAAACAAMEGRFRDAKQLNAEARKYGGTEDYGVTLGYAAMVIAIRLEEGRAAEVVDGLVDVGSWFPPAWLTLVGATLAEVGRVDEARAVVAELVDEGLTTIPRDWFFPLALGRLAELSLALDDAAAAAVLLPHVEPFSGQLMVVSAGTLVDSAGDRAVGHLLAALGRIEEADRRYRDAAALEDSVGAAALAARTRYWHGRLLAGVDPERSRQLLERAHAEATRLGMQLLAEQAAAVSPGSPGSAA